MHSGAEERGAGRAGMPITRWPLRRVLIAAVLLILAYGFWVSGPFTEIAAGVALFLFGMVSLEAGFKAFTGGTLEATLRRSTDRLWKSIGFGIASTALMQSSTLVSLVTISFVSAEMIGLAAGIGIIMGANLGTTTGAWLIAGLGLRVDIGAYAMPVLVFGVILRLQSSRNIGGLGAVLLGIGFLFLGIHYMKEGFEALQNGFDLTAYALAGWPGLILFTGLGMVVTVIMQSSHATLLVIITALAAGQVTYENALALAIGANLGTAITTAVGGMAANLSGRRLAVAHVLFNVATAAVAIVFIGQMMWAVERLSELLGFPEDAFALRLAVFHSLFNLVGVVLLAPFVTQLERALVRYVQFAPASGEQPLFLYPEAIKTPAAAVAAVRKEIGHLYDNAADLIIHGLSLHPDVVYSGASLELAVRNTRGMRPLDVDDAYEAKIKGLHSAIVAFIAEIEGRELQEGWIGPLYTLQQASQNIVEAVKAMKHLHKNLSRHGLSSNASVRAHYDGIRLEIATLLRDIRRLRAEGSDAEAAAALDALERELEASSGRRMDALGQMIRRNLVSAHVATSMMNDEGYAGKIGASLTLAARALVTATETVEDITSARRPSDDAATTRR